MKALILVSLMIGAVANASEYPSTYQISRTTQTQGPVAVSRGMEIAYEKALVEVTYSGSLATHSGLKMWIQVNYNDGPRQGLFDVESQAMGHFAQVQLTGGCLVSNEDGGCQQMGSQDMNSLLFWAQSGSQLNGLDIELAFVDGEGHWDNNGSHNYHFHF